MLNINIAIISDFIKYFAYRQIEEKAREVGFTRRNDGKLNPVTFVKAFTLGLWECQYATIQHAAQICEDTQTGLRITKQALHQRLTPGVKLLKAMLDIAVNYTLKHSSKVYEENIFGQFENVYICDSSHLSLPDKLESYFKGIGGASKSKAAIKMQTMFNVVTRSFRDIQIRRASEPDEEYLEDILHVLQENDLIIFDLGYFNRDFFRKVNEKGSFYLSRLRRYTSFYPNMKASKNQDIPINRILDASKDFIDTQVYIGQDKKTRISVRLIAAKLPPNIVNERLRKESKRARGKTLTQKTKTLLSWNIVITNAKADVLSTEKAFALYKTRWQIEIIFKAWKSYLGLRNVAHGGKEQVECMLYGRLIVITLMTTIYSRFYFLMYHKDKRELSLLKFFSLLRHKVTAMLGCLDSRDSVLKMYALLFKASSISLYDKRRRKTSLEIIINCTTPVLATSG